MKFLKNILNKKAVEYNALEEALIQNKIPTEAVLYITQAVSNLPYKDVKFGLQGYTLSRVTFNPRVEKELKDKKKSILFVDIDCYSERVLESPKRTLTVNHTFYMKGHDGNTWKLVITTFCYTHTVDRDHDDVLVDVCSTYCKGIVELNDFSCITPASLDIPELDKLYLKGKRHYDGYITRYSSSEKLDDPKLRNESIISEDGITEKTIKTIDIDRRNLVKDAERKEEYNKEMNNSGDVAYFRMKDDIRNTAEVSEESIKKAEERLKNFHKKEEEK